MLGTILLPAHIIGLIGETFAEAMAYPELDIPMYKPLVDRSTELFVPNLHLIEQNTVTLLETNQRFIEAYMVGLNHEFARELLWREYPTDQRGSYFRQFWDVSDVPRRDRATDGAAARGAEGHPAAAPVVAASELGDHDHREQAARERGGARARDPRRAAQEVSQRRDLRPEGDAGRPKSDDRPDARTRPRSASSTPDEPDRARSTPLYEAKVEPDIYFFGFDLDRGRGRAATTPSTTSRAGSS